MLRSFWILFILLSISLFALGTLPEYQLEVTGRIERQNNRYIIYLAGKTNLPEATRLEAEVSYLKKVAVPRIIREEMGKDYEIEPVSLDKGMTKIKNGGYLFKLGYYQRKPYSGEYLAKVRFELASQPKKIRDLLPSEMLPIEQTIEFSFGTQIDFEQEKVAVKKGVYRDLVRINNLYQMLETKVKRVIKGDFEEDAWQQWHQDWQKQINDLEENNRLRLDQSIYWLESAGKQAIKWLIEELSRLGQEFTKTRAYKQFQTGSHNFLQLLENKLYELGYQKIIDTDKVKNLIKSIANTYTMIKNSSSNNNDENLTKWRASLELDLFKLTQELPGFIFATYLLPLSQDLLDYLAVANKTEDQRRNLELRIKNNLDGLKEYLADFE